MIKIESGEKLAKVLCYYGLEYQFEGKYKIVCPLHGDVNPSMMIDLSSGKWYCFGCAHGGNALELAVELEKKYHNLDELEAAIKYVHILSSKKVEKIKYSAQKKKKKIQKKSRSDY